MSNLDALTRMQAYSGIAFSSFATMHLFNHIMGIFGKSIQYHASWQKIFRKYYHIPIIEIGLGTSLLVHMYCGIRKFLSRKEKVSSSLPLSRKYHRYHGYVLFIFTIPHLYATRICPLIALGPKESENLDVTLATLSFRLVSKYFYLYYTFLFASGLYHTVYGLYLSNILLDRSNKKKPSDILTSMQSKYWQYFGGSCVIIGAIASAAICGGLFSIDITREDLLQKTYDVLIPAFLHSYLLPWHKTK